MDSSDKVIALAPGLWDKLNLDIAAGKFTPKIAGKELLPSLAAASALAGTVRSARSAR